MQKKVLACLVLGIACIGCRRSDPPAQAAPSAPVQLLADDPANWMGANLAVLGDRTLKQLTLPASHDSAMYDPSFPQSLARTQNLSIYQQLAAGIRYFDLRPQWKANQLFIHHGSMTGPILGDVLGDVKKFMAESHHELILLNFSHFDGFTTEHYGSLIQEIHNALGPWLYQTLPPGKRLADVPLHDYIDHGGRILALCDGSYPLDHRSAGIWIYRNWDSSHPQQGDLRVYDQYSNTMSYEKMERDQLAKFDRYDGYCRNHPDVPCDLFLLSWTLTPPTGVLAMAKTPNEHLAAHLAGVKVPNRYGSRINLLYADGVDSWLTKVAIEQNQR